MTTKRPPPLVVVEVRCANQVLRHHIFEEFCLFQMHLAAIFSWDIGSEVFPLVLEMSTSLASGGLVFAVVSLIVKNRIEVRCFHRPQKGVSASFY